MTMKKRVLIIGLDGFTWRLGRDFMSEGVMSNLANLVNKGTHGILWSVMPFETSPAWSSFQTGCLPGRTSIFAFHRYDRNLKKISLNSFADNAMPSLWELLDRADRRVISLNMPVSSPPPKVNGIIIPGLLCPKLSPETVHPPEAYNKYIKPRRNYLIVNNRFQDTVKEFTQQSIATEQIRTQVALELIHAENWDVFCMQMQSSDVMQHRIWTALDQTAKGHSPDQRKEALPFYRFCDDAIGRLVAAAGQNTLTLIVSDHGFCQAKDFFAINLWLRQRGYLHLLPKKETNWEITKRKIPPLKMLARLYGNTVQKFSNDNNKKLFCEEVLGHLRRILDFEKTRAFCLGGMAGILYINGTKQQRLELAQQITEELLNDFGPGTRQPIIDRITSGQETYGRDNDSDSLPDLVVQYQEGYITKIHPLGDDIVAPDIYRGTHGRDGVLVAYGPGIREGVKLDGNIVDIVPTVLAYLGVPIPGHVDGKVLDGAFIKPPDTSYEDISVDSTRSVEYSDAEQAVVEKHLRDLGYL